jgi:hypothetical protein
MIYKALLKKINPDIEEEVVLTINDMEFICFVSYMPYELKEGNFYTIEVELTFLDNIVIKKSEIENKSVERIGLGFSHSIRGVLKEGGVLDSVLDFQDDIFSEYSYFIGEYITVIADRITVSFI